MSDFGILFRSFRESCRDPDFPARRLPQQKFGELLGRELGMFQGYSGTAVSDWERGKSKIHADDRFILVAIIKLLYQHGGIKTMKDADSLLEAGNYRALNTEEIYRIFQETPSAEHSQTESGEKTFEVSSLSWLADMLSISQKELKQMLDEARKGPEPSWPRVLASLMRKATAQLSLSMSTILWIAVWLLTIWLISPSLRFPFATYNSAFFALCIYAGASLSIPLLIGALVNTKSSEYWSRQSGVSSFLLRLYTYQGAGVGFNVGYFLMLPLSLVRHYLGFEPAIWIEILAATTSVVLGSMGAHIVPHNLWLAFKRLTLKDGGIFFVVALMGPLWAFFFLEFYSTLLHPVLGIVVILLALSGVVFAARRRSHKQTA